MWSCSLSSIVHCDCRFFIRHDCHCEGSATEIKLLVHLPSSRFSLHITLASQAETQIDHSNSMSVKDLEGLTPLIAKIRDRKWIKTLRGVQLFLHPNNFSKPRNTNEALSRAEVNALFFLTNYIVLCIVILLYALLSRPFVVLVLSLLCLSWYVALQRDVLYIGPYALKGKNKLVALASVSGLVILFTAGTTLFVALGVCSTLICLHVVFHNTPENSDAMDGSADLSDMAAVPGTGHNSDISSGGTGWSSLLSTITGKPAVSSGGSVRERLFDVEGGAPSAGVRTPSHPTPP